MITIVQLTNYIFSAMLAWSPVNEHTSPGIDEDSVEQYYWSIAGDIATVALDPVETAVQDRRILHDPTGQVLNAMLVTSVAFNETRFWKFVDDGLCNDPEWRKTKSAQHTMI